MSYFVSAYRVELERLQRVFGCKDAELLRSIEQRFAAQLLDDETPQEARVWHKGATKAALEILPLPDPTLRQAFADIVDGMVRPVDTGANYIYALEGLCTYFGVDLPNDPFNGFSGVGILEGFPGLEPLAYWSRRPLPIPALPPADGFPGVTYLTNAEVWDKLAQVRLIEPAALYDDPFWEAWDEEWIDEAHATYRS